MSKKIKIITDCSNFSKDSIENLILNSSIRYLRDTGTLGLFMMTLTRESCSIPMRKLEHFVMKYSKINNINYLLVDPANPHKAKKYYVYEEYRKKISDYKKKNFCFFRRDEQNKVDVTAIMGDKKITFSTTPGQANLYSWLVQDRVIDYVVDNYEAIFGTSPSAEVLDFKKHLEKSKIR